MKAITVCTMDCPDACSLVATSEPDGSLRIRGNPEHPFTKGIVCGKIKKHVERLKNPARIAHPMLKKDGAWERISWEEALDLCAEKIDRLRKTPESILHIHGEGAKGVVKQVGKLFFNLLGATRLKGSLCDAAGIVAYYKDFGSRKNHDLADLLDSRKIAIWGKDLSRSSIHTADMVKSAKKRGASVLSISPEGGQNRLFSDHGIVLRPGTDRLLAAAAIRRLLQRRGAAPCVVSASANWDKFRRLIEKQSVSRLLSECDVSEKDLETLCDYYSDDAPCATLVGAGIQRYEFGGENVRFVNALAMVSGNIGRPGGGSYFHLNSLGNFDTGWTRPDDAPPQRVFREPLVGKEILAADPPVKMVWVNGSNIVNQAPDIETMRKAFERIEFKVVADAFMTDTAQLADLFLPCTLMLEQDDVVGSYVHHFVHLADAVATPPGLARDDHWIFSRVAERLSPPIRLPDKPTCIRKSLESGISNLSLDELRRRRFIMVERERIPYQGLVFDHRDGKYRFPRSLHPEPSPPPGYPLRLLSLVRRNAIHSQIPPENQSSPPLVRVSPETLRFLNIDPERKVYLVSPLGRMEVRIETKAGLYPGALVYRRGDWYCQGGGVNRLVEAFATDMGSGAAFYRQYVRLEN